MMNLLRRLAEEAQEYAAPEGRRQSESVVSQSFRQQTPQLNSMSTSIPESSVSSNISSSDDGVECSSPNLTHGQTTNIQEEEIST